MNDKQLDEFKRLIKNTSDNKLEQFIDDEIKSMPDDEKRTDFLKGVKDSAFHQEFFMRGFMEGINFTKENKN